MSMLRSVFMAQMTFSIAHKFLKLLSIAFADLNHFHSSNTFVASSDLLEMHQNKWKDLLAALFSLKGASGWGLDISRLDLSRKPVSWFALGTHDSLPLSDWKVQHGHTMPLVFLSFNLHWETPHLVKGTFSKEGGPISVTLLPGSLLSWWSIWSAQIWVEAIPN